MLAVVNLLYKEQTDEKILIISLLSLWLTACGSGIDGTYADDIGIYNYTFEPNGKVMIREKEQMQEYDYHVDGDQVFIELSEEDEEVLGLVDLSSPPLL